MNRNQTMRKQMENESGITPVEFKVLVKPDEVKKKTDGGIIIPETSNQQRQAAECKGTVVALGGMAFKDFEGCKPKIGDRISMNKYAGVQTTGKDDQEYRIINDKEVNAVISF